MNWIRWIELNVCGPLLSFTHCGVKASENKRSGTLYCSNTSCLVLLYSLVLFFSKIRDTSIKIVENFCRCPESCRSEFTFSHFVFKTGGRRVSESGLKGVSSPPAVNAVTKSTKRCSPFIVVSGVSQERHWRATLFSLCDCRCCNIHIEFESEFLFLTHIVSLGCFQFFTVSCSPFYFVFTNSCW